ncbi:MAG TPA: M56 family metallopeptidase [Polyangiaceae bacterium]|nr:M56 family metallopeptidase [Polyangiaceae bacterium]
MIHLAVFGMDAGMSALSTYLVHSTVWVAAALLLARLQRQLSPAARHAVWRAALIGPLVSSAFMLGMCVCHRWQWALTRASSASEAWTPALPRAAALAQAAPLSRAAALSQAAPLSRADALAPAAALPFVRPAETMSASVGAPLGVDVSQHGPWFARLVACWALVAVAGLLLLARAALRQRRALAARTPVTDAACIEALARLTKRAGIRHPIRLSRCAAASTPFVLNAGEVCLPDRALELEPDALEAVLAHEVAHIERHDGLWQTGVTLLQALLWFQPLHRKARAELQATAELAADDRAVELTGNALGLARTLTEVASWSSGGRFVPAVAMARAGSPIVERVERLVESSDRRSRGRFGAQASWLALAALAAIGACSPSIGAPRGEGAHAAHPPTNPGPAVVTPPVAPDAPKPVPLGDVRPPLAAPSAMMPPAAVPTPAMPMPPLPNQSPAGDVLASVLPRAGEFSKSVTQLALNEHRLGIEIALAERAAAEPGAPATARAELARLKGELAASQQQRQQLERDFEAHMKDWRTQFEARFNREHAAKMAAWGEQFERQMQGMAKDLERRLSGLRHLPLPEPPALPDPLPNPSTVPVPRVPALP